MDNDEIDICRYETVTITNNNRNTICASNDLEEVNHYFEDIVNNISDNSKDHIIVFIYDYDKNANINYYDNRIDIC